MQATQAKFPDALAHSSITKEFEGVYIVTGTYIATYGDEQWQFSRNMTIVKQGDQLTLINAIRLNDDGLAELDRLGNVSDIIKLGAAHGIDNAFYADRYKAQVWALEQDRHEDGLPTSQALCADHLPLADASLHSFRSAKPEAILQLKRDGGILVTCDAIKNWSEVDPYFSAASGEKMAAYGMIRPVDIDRNWIASCGIAKDDFEQLLALEFRHLIPGHGQVLRNTAHDQVKDAVANAFA